MYTWKDKVWDGVAIGVLALTCVPLILFLPLLLIVAKFVDKFFPTDYKDRIDYWQM